ncbi:MAG TPA: F0F1 ATP synthase subunit A [Vicinamibacterales bacterium]
MVPQAPVPEAQAAGQAFNPGDLILGHVSNTPLAHPLIHLPTVFGIDLSVTKHVFMLWAVAATVFVVITTLVQRFVRQPRLVPGGPMNVLEVGVEFIRDTVVEPNISRKWTGLWTPLILTFFLFILCANMVGLVPIFDVLGLLNHYVFHPGEDAFLARLVHGGPIATGNYNVTAALATITFIATILAGTLAHGFIKHWKNLVPPGLPAPLYVLLIPMEIVSMFVRPFALTMRLAANMTGGHIAILAITSFVFIFASMFGTWLAGAGIGVVFSVPLAVGISGIEIIVVLVQAYVFTLLSAVFIGMAINANH